MEAKYYRVIVKLSILVVLSVFMAATAFAQTYPAGMISYWKFDEPSGNIAVDAKGINNGTLVNSPTRVAGKVGGALSLSGGKWLENGYYLGGTEDYVSVPHHPSLNITGPFTFEAWINLNINYGMSIFDKPLFAPTPQPGNDSPNYRWFIGWGGTWGPTMLGLWSRGGLAVGNTNLGTGNWRHIATTFDGTLARFYVDGQLDATGPFGLGSTTTGPLLIGRDSWETPRGRYVDGVIDEVAIYNRALTLDEIQKHYQNGLNGKGYEEVNQGPFANAGPDQTVDEWSPVILDGSGSYDPDGDTLTYNWKQIAGTTVSLDITDPKRPTFTAPEVPAGGNTLTFELSVSDGQLTSSDIVNIIVKNVNHPPVADAGDNQWVKEGSRVTLHGEDSYDPDNEKLTYYWEQTAGTAVTLSDATAAMPYFDAPLVGQAGKTLIFKLTVSDGIDSAADTVDVFVENVNHPPIAEAGEGQTKNEKSLVMLNGTGSRDPDGDPLTFWWTQISGPEVALSDRSSDTPSFTAPLVGSGGATLVFQLMVNDGLGGIAYDDVTISVLNINDPPNCALALAKPDRLWPPNHGLVPIKIVNLTDPNNDQVSITVIGVTQDEPVNGLGDGDTSPDATISGGNIMVRAERAGTGNGRVYQITFRADDSFGEGCTGVVTVCVPHDRKDGACGNDGQIYISTNQ